MVTNCAVAAHKVHVAALSLASVGKDPLRSPTVHISVLATGLAGEEENVRRSFGSGNSTTFLAAVFFVDVALTVVKRTFLEGYNAASNIAGLGHLKTKSTQLFGNSPLTTAKI
jgi:hypothetical protein